MIATAMTASHHLPPAVPGPDAGPTPAWVASRVGELVAFAELARESDLIAWESSQPDEIRHDLVPGIEHASGRVVALLTDLGTALDRVVGDGFAEGGPEAVRLARDVVWVARMELAQRTAQLTAARQVSDTWILLSLSEACLRKIVAVCAGVERHLAPLVGATPRLPAAVGLAGSLRIRAAYADFRHQLREAAGLDLGRRLHRAATLIAQLVGDEVFRHLRISDRCEFRHLQERLNEWTRRPFEEGFNAAEHVEDGEHLWQDLGGFSALLQQVNRRGELVEHDSRAIAALLAELSERPPGAVADGELLTARLETLRGRDPRFDALLREGAATCAEWVECLRRLSRAQTLESDLSAELGGA